jgi:NTE family protein
MCAGDWEVGMSTIRERVETLRAFDGFAGMSDRRLSTIAKELDDQHLASGEVLVRALEPADALYLLRRGRLAVELPNGTTTTIDLGPNGIVGEVGILSTGHRSATVRASRSCELLRLSSAAFERLTASVPEFVAAMSQFAIGRLLRPPMLAAGISKIVVDGAGSTPQKVGPVSRSLGDGLRQLGPAIAVSRTMAARQVAGAADNDAALDPALGSALSQWLDNISRDHRFIVLEADPTFSAWTRWALHEADCIVLVSDGVDPSIGAQEQMLTATSLPRHLLLVHPEGTILPSGTATCLVGRDVASHHHARFGNRRDFARVARLLAGEATTLVLGGGGARGLAHLGVMSALDDAGVEIDAVGGTSIGAIMGASLAIGWDDPTRIERALHAFRRRRLVGPTLPLVSLSSSKVLTGLLRSEEHFGDIAIEDLWLPFFCVSTSLGSARPVVHDRGPLWFAVRASASLPGLLPPVFDGGDLLVDGGLVSNLPVAEMRDRVRGRLIAVDLEPELDDRAVDRFAPTLSGWRALGQRLRPFTPAPVIPNVLETMARAKEVSRRWGHEHQIDLRDIDLLVRPGLKGVGTLAFKRATELIDAGREAAKHALVASGDRVASDAELRPQGGLQSC